MKKILLLFLLVSYAFAQYAGQWSAHTSASYSLAVHELRAWFTGAYNIELGLGQQQDSPWQIEGIIDYTHFTSLHAVEDGIHPLFEEIPLELWYVGLMAQVKYRLSQRSISPFVSIAAGPHYWRGSRGAISENSTYSIPEIPEKILSEWNMGFKAGVGVEVFLGNTLSLESGVAYRLVIGSLWPTMQEYVELEAVNGFSSANMYLRANIFF